jgi:peptide/nickel transport system substrate-binding protein
MDPFFAMVRFSSSRTVPPTSNNWGYYTSPELDAIIAKARTSFVAADRDAALAQLHAQIVEDAPFLWVAHDVGPRAMSAKIKGYVQPKSWFVDLAPVSID